MRYYIAIVMMSLLCASAAYAQKAPLPANTFMASPCGTTGNLAPRAPCQADFATVFASPPAIGSTTPGAISASTLTSNNIVSTELPGLTTNVLGSTGYPGLQMSSCTSLATCTFMLYETPTNQTGALQSPLYIQRNTNGLTGTCPSCGTTSTVPSALNIIDFAGRNDISWNAGVAVGFFDKSLGSGLSQDGAGLFYAMKQNSTGGGEVGFLWGINSYCYDQQPTVNPLYSCVGAEIDALTVAAAGADTNGARVALNIVGGVTPGTDAAVHIGTGMQISTIGGATMDRGISYFAGIYGSLITTKGGGVTATNGIDWSNVVFSGFEFKTANFLLDTNGNETLSSGTPLLTFNPPVVNSRGIQGQTNGVLRWQILPGNSTAEGVANAGSDLSINSFSDAGGFLAMPLNIKRSTGLTTLTSLSLPVSANAAVATVLGSVGPTGSHTTVQEWIQVVGTGGAIRYVPGF